MPADPDLVAVVLAAGQGKRMKSSLVKVLHPLRGRPLVHHVVDAVRGAGASRVVVVVGVQADRVQDSLGSGVEFVRQDPPLGTAHAVMASRPALAGYQGDILVVYGDLPLLRSPDLRALVEKRRAAAAALAFLTAVVDNPTGFGRVMRDQAGKVTGIVEEADCTPEQRRVNEVNVGVYCFLAARLWDALERVGRGNAQSEFYLPDAVRILLDEGEHVVALPVPPHTVAQINDRVQLAGLEGALRKRCLEDLMRRGVTVVDPASAFLDDRVEAEADVVVGPCTVVEGEVRIRKGASLGPFAVVRQQHGGLGKW